MQIFSIFVLKTKDAQKHLKQGKGIIMKQGYTHICVVLDASGSMESIENDVKGSFSNFLQTQREIEGKTVFDLFQFSDEVTRLVKSADLALFKDDLMKKYKCSGCTALNDAVCTAIDTIGKEFAAMPENERPEHVLFAIITDGEENASRKFTTEDVKDRIEHQTNVYNWNFDFLAANQDAFATGRQMGLMMEDCATFEASPEGASFIGARMCSRAKAVRQPKKKK